MACDKMDRTDSGDRGKFMKRLLNLITLLVVFTATLSAQTFTREIKVTKPRMNGADVSELQRTLLSLGFDDVGEVDGYFGPMSSNALQQYQGLAGFEQTGIFTKANFDFLYNKSSLNLQFNLALQKFNLVTKCKTYEEDSVFLKDPFYQSSEGAGMVFYKDGKTTVYAYTNICGSMGNFTAYFIPLGSGDYLYIEQTNEYDIPMGNVISSTYETYLCSNGKLYKVKNGSFTSTTEAQAGRVLTDLKKAVKN